MTNDRRRSSSVNYENTLQDNLSMTQNSAIRIEEFESDETALKNQANPASGSRKKKQSS